MTIRRLWDLAIWVAVGLLAFFLNVSSAKGEPVPFNEEIRGIRSWEEVNIQTIAGPVKIFCSIPGFSKKESICITARQEIFVEKGRDGLKFNIEEGKVLSRAPSMEAAVGLAVETINKIVEFSRITGKVPPKITELLPREAPIPARKVLPEEI